MLNTKNSKIMGAIEANLTGTYNNIVAFPGTIAKSEAAKAANRKYSKKVSEWRKREKLARIKRELQEIVGDIPVFLDSLERKDRILFEELLKGTTQDQIALLIGKKDRRFVATRKRQVLDKWERRKPGKES